MSFLHSLLLGLVQALTEFFPISSSAHLRLVKHFLQIQDETPLLDLSCHAGTLLALLWFLRKDLKELFVRPMQFFIALTPLVHFYFLLKPLREWASQNELLGICLMLTGCILLAGKVLRTKRTQKNLKDAFFIGCMQSAALIPGISRSASTISCARVLGWDVKESLRFSFLLSIPTILGGSALELLKAGSHLSSISYPPLVIGFVTAFLGGMMVIKKAFAYLEKGNFAPFAWYCLALGAAVTLYFH